MTATFMNALYEAFAHALKKPGVVYHPLVEYITIIQPANVRILEMWQLGRDTIMYHLA